jgi:hypothetical protein
MTWVNDNSETRQRTPTEKAILESFRQKWEREREAMRHRNPEYVLQQDARRMLDVWEREAAQGDALKGPNKMENLIELCRYCTDSTPLTECVEQEHWERRLKACNELR